MVAPTWTTTYADANDVQSYDSVVSKSPSSL